MAKSSRAASAVLALGLGLSSLPSIANAALAEPPAGKFVLGELATILAMLEKWWWRSRAAGDILVKAYSFVWYTY